MKFNWKANWEILLVLAIIVIGIAITTIAAIRNKDKQFLTISDETDFSQLIAGSGGISETSSVVDGQAESGNSDGGQSTKRPHAQPIAKSSRLPMFVPQGGSKDASLVSNQRHQRGDQPSNGNSKYDDLAEFNQLPFSDSHQGTPATITGSAQVSPNSQDPYESLSTEATPSQNRAPDSTSASQSNQRPYDTKNIGIYKSTNNIPQDLSLGRQDPRKLAKGLQTFTPSTPNTELDQAVDPSDSNDDIHAPRTTIGAFNDQIFRANGQLDHSIPPSLSLHGPYGASPPQLDQLGQLLANNIDKLHDSGSIIDTDDMMTSYTRIPSNNTTSENLMREFSLSNPYGNSSNIMSAIIGAQPPQDSIFEQTNTRLSNSIPLNQPKQLSSAPLTALINDILKMARPKYSVTREHHPSHGYSGGILQQLHSMPGPLLGLIQDSYTGSGSGNPIGHDASESNHHYQRISAAPADIHSILARSIRTSGVLPGFPAPKGAPQSWISRTSDGQPNFNTAASSNADFVATNAAGYLRANQQAHSQTIQRNEIELNNYQNPQANDDYQKRTSTPDSSSFQQSNENQQNAQKLVNSDQDTGDQKKTSSSWLNQPQTATRSENFASSQANPSMRDNFAHTLTPNNAQMIQLNQQQPNNNPTMGNNGLINQQQQPSLPQAMKYSNKPALQIQVPLGYNPSRHNSFEINQLQTKQQNFPVPITLKTITRRKRSSDFQKADGFTKSRTRRSDIDIEDNNDEDDYADSPKSVSVVRPDGRPIIKSKYRGISNGRSDRSGEARRQTVNYRKNSLSHAEVSKPSLRIHTKGKHEHEYSDESNNDVNQSSSKSSANEPEKRSTIRSRDKNSMNMIAESSGLMNRLLGSASANDELEDDMDDDDDSANEKRRDELDDAEFGIGNDDRSKKITNPSNREDGGYEPKSGRSSEKSRTTSKGEPDSSVGSGTTDNQSYSRRNQQRSDVEFYGHPGEETRQLKYGILGSGNYEVVNGGIYPEADESTAAVNSIAKYVRKPGLILGGFPKLLTNGHGENMNAHTGFMAGDRVNGGYMRGASAHPDETIGLVGDPGIESDLSKGMINPILELIEANNGQLFHPNMLAQLGSSGTSSKSIHTNEDPEESPIRYEETEIRRPMNSAEKGMKNEINSRINSSSHNSRKTDKNSVKRKNSMTRIPDSRPSQLDADLETNRVASDEDNAYIINPGDDPSRTDAGTNRSNSSISRGSNQFNSYQISPSKKVTIFSDEDLDSAPSNDRSVNLSQVFGSRLRPLVS